MKRILIPFSFMHTPLIVLAFCQQILKGKSVPVYGIFFKKPAERIRFRYPFPNDFPLTEKKISPEDAAAENSRLMSDKIKLFMDDCEAEGIEYQIEKDISLKQFIGETSGTDLMITDTKADFLEDVVPHLHCPAYLVSESEPPRNRVLLCDGSESGKYAAKMYASFFPEWRNLPATVVCVCKSEKEPEIETYIESELEPRFANLKIQFLEGDKEKKLITFLEQQGEHTLVVMGASVRSTISSFFHKSLADLILENTKCSLFIARR